MLLTYLAAWICILMHSSSYLFVFSRPKRSDLRTSGNEQRPKLFQSLRQTRKRKMEKKIGLIRTAFMDFLSEIVQ